MVDAAIFWKGFGCQLSVVVENDSRGLSDSRLMDAAFRLSLASAGVSKIVWGDDANRSRSLAS